MSLPISDYSDCEYVDGMAQRWVDERRRRDAARRAEIPQKNDIRTYFGASTPRSDPPGPDVASGIKVAAGSKRKRSNVPHKKTAWRQRSTNNTPKRWHSLTLDEQTRERADADAMRKKARTAKTRADNKAKSNHADWSEEFEASVLEARTADSRDLRQFAQEILASIEME